MRVVLRQVANHPGRTFTAIMGTPGGDQGPAMKLSQGCVATVLIFSAYFTVAQTKADDEILKRDGCAHLENPMCLILEVAGASYDISAAERPWPDLEKGLGIGVTGKIDPVVPACMAGATRLKGVQKDVEWHYTKQDCKKP
jgi:hypothetical protein